MALNFSRENKGRHRPVISPFEALRFPDRDIVVVGPLERLVQAGGFAPRFGHVVAEHHVLGVEEDRKAGAHFGGELRQAGRHAGTELVQKVHQVCATRMRRNGRSGVIAADTSRWCCLPDAVRCGSLGKNVCKTRLLKIPHNEADRLFSGPAGLELPFSFPSRGGLPSDVFYQTPDSQRSTRAHRC